MTNRLSQPVHQVKHNTVCTEPCHVSSLPMFWLAFQHQYRNGVMPTTLTWCCQEIPNSARRLLWTIACKASRWYFLITSMHLIKPLFHIAIGPKIQNPKFKTMLDIADQAIKGIAVSTLRKTCGCVILSFKQKMYLLWDCLKVCVGILFLCFFTLTSTHLGPHCSQGNQSDMQHMAGRQYWCIFCHDRALGWGVCPWHMGPRACIAWVHADELFLQQSSPQIMLYKIVNQLQIVHKVRTCTFLLIIWLTYFSNIGWSSLMSCILITNFPCLSLLSHQSSIEFLLRELNFCSEFSFFKIFKSLLLQRSLVII